MSQHSSSRSSKLSASPAPSSKLASSTPDPRSKRGGNNANEGKTKGKEQATPCRRGSDPALPRSIQLASSVPEIVENNKKEDSVSVETRSQVSYSPWYHEQIDQALSEYVVPTSPIIFLRRLIRVLIHARELDESTWSSGERLAADVLSNPTSNTSHRNFLCALPSPQIISYYLLAIVFSVS